MEAELSYYRRRSMEESRAAATATDSKARSVHLELGRRYLERVSIIEAEFRRQQMQLRAEQSLDRSAELADLHQQPR